jgi:hypothetical protein
MRAFKAPANIEAVAEVETFTPKELEAPEKAPGADIGTPGDGVSLDDFYAFMPSHSYIFAPSREMWPAASVNARVPPVVLTDDSGNPKLDEKGNETSLPANASPARQPGGDVTAASTPPGGLSLEPLRRRLGGKIASRSRIRPAAVCLPSPSFRGSFHFSIPGNL